MSQMQKRVLKSAKQVTRSRATPVDEVLTERLKEATGLAGVSCEKNVDEKPNVPAGNKPKTRQTRESLSRGITTRGSVRPSGLETIASRSSEGSSHKTDDSSKRKEISPSEPLYMQFNEALTKLFQRYRELSSSSFSSRMTSPEFSQISVMKSNNEEMQTRVTIPKIVKDSENDEIKIKESISLMNHLLFPPIGTGVPHAGYRNYIVATARVQVNSPKVTGDTRGSSKNASALQSSRAVKKTPHPESSKKGPKVKPPIIRYQLSSLENIMNGYTSPPEGLEMTRLYSFEAESSEEKFSCFRTREAEETRYYRDGSLAIRFELDGTGTIYYPNGDPAVLISDSKIGRRMLILSQSGKEESSGVFKKAVPIGMFDRKGNGVVYNINGDIRMNYDQAQGVLYDSPCGLPVRWKWEAGEYVLERRQELAAVAEDPPDWEADPWDPPPQQTKKKAPPTVKKGKRASSRATAITGTANKQNTANQPTSAAICCNPPPTQRTTAMSTAGTRESRKEATQKSDSIKTRHLPAPGKPFKWRDFTKANLIVLKLNQYIALRLMNQGHIHVDFQCQQIHISLNIGVTVKPDSLERIDKGINSVGTKVPCYFESAFMRTRSLRVLNQAIGKIRKNARKESHNKIIQRANLWGYPKEERMAKLKKSRLVFQLLKKQGGKLSQ